MTPITVVLLLELRGQRSKETKRFTCQVAGAEDATLESLTPYVLEKTTQNDFGIFVKRTRCTHPQYDAQTRTLQVQHSLPASKGWDFIYELEQGFGFKEEARAASVA
jgi:hypothetical protein